MDRGFSTSRGDAARGWARLIAAGVITALLGTACGPAFAASGRQVAPVVQPAAADAAAVEEQPMAAEAIDDSEASEIGPPAASDIAAPMDAARALRTMIDPLRAQHEPFHTRTSPPERLVIPSIGLDARIVPIGVHRDRTGALVWDTAPFAVGHHQGTVFPGETGNVVLSGHISSPNEGDIFRRLPQVKLQDGIVVITAQQPHLYRVSDIRITGPDAVQVIDQTPSPVLTLITCVPDGLYSHRLVIRAEAL
jgi:LPXTG-site transpeptidase (sortase) family protein